MPKVGQEYTPKPGLPKTTAKNFRGRAAIEALVAKEVDPVGLKEGCPSERTGEVLSWLDAGKLDAPTWIRIPVRGGLEVEVMADVVSFGDVRLCMSMVALQGIADAWNCLLLTAGISDAIWRAADIKFAPQPIDPNPGGAIPWMLYYADRVADVEQLALEAWLAESGWSGAFKPKLLVTLGKDYTLDSRQTWPENRDDCCIYGWHWLNGSPIQSKKSGGSFIHPLRFYDYSQMGRLVRRNAWLDGEPVKLEDIYQKRPELVAYTTAMTDPIPTRHPLVPFRAPAGTQV